MALSREQEMQRYSQPGRDIDVKARIRRNRVFNEYLVERTLVVLSLTSAPFSSTPLQGSEKRHTRKMLCAFNSGILRSIAQ